MSQPTTIISSRTSSDSAWCAPKEILPDVLKGRRTERRRSRRRARPLLEEEIAAREERRIRGALRLAGLPFVRTLDAFDFAFQPFARSGLVLDLASLAFLARKENVLLLGPRASASRTWPSHSPSAPARTGPRSTSPRSTT